MNEHTGTWTSVVLSRGRTGQMSKLNKPIFVFFKKGIQY